MATSFSGGRSQSTRGEPPTIGKQLENMPREEMFFDWSLPLNVLHMIWWLKMNERLPNMTPERILLHVNV
jgi:hypothetical protein